MIRLSIAFVGWLVALAFSANTAMAATYTWNNPSGSNWNTVTNWVGGLPTSAATTDLVFGDTTQYASTLDIGTGAFSVKTITFNNSWAGSGAAITLNRAAAQTLTLADAAGG